MRPRTMMCMKLSKKKKIVSNETKSRNPNKDVEHIPLLEVKTRKEYNSTSGAKPTHSNALAITPATNVPCPNKSSLVPSSVQSVRSMILRK